MVKSVGFYFVEPEQLKGGRLLAVLDLFVEIDDVLGALGISHTFLLGEELSFLLGLLFPIVDVGTAAYQSALRRFVPICTILAYAIVIVIVIAIFAGTAFSVVSTTVSSCYWGDISLIEEVSSGLDCHRHDQPQDRSHNSPSKMVIHSCAPFVMSGVSDQHQHHNCALDDFVDLTRSSELEGPLRFEYSIPEVNVGEEEEDGSCEVDLDGGED